MMWSELLSTLIAPVLCSVIWRIEAWVHRGSQVVLALIFYPPCGSIKAWANRRSQVCYVNCACDEFRACPVAAINTVAHDIDVCPADHTLKAMMHRFGFRPTQGQVGEAGSPARIRI
jgi:hypothetical protein